MLAQSLAKMDIHNQGEEEGEIEESLLPHHLKSSNNIRYIYIL